MKNILYATSNQGKIMDAQTSLRNFDIQIEGIDIEVPEIQTDDVYELIRDKVNKCYDIVQKPLVAMDAGLFIPELKGFPGVNSKYINKTIGEDGLITLVKVLKDRSAYIQRTIAYTDGRDIQIFVSRGEGELITEKRGDNGYFFDFIFYVPTKKKTLAELTNEEKCEVWGDAWEQLGKYLLNI